MKAALDLRASAILVVLCASWGLNQVAIKVTLAGIPPAFQMGARSALAALLIFLWCVLRGKPLFRSDRSLVPGIAVGILFALEFLAIYWGLLNTTASRGVILIYLSPFVVALGGHFLLNEPLGVRKLAGLAAAFLGIVLAFSDSLSLPSRDALFGDALCLLGAILWGSTTVLVKGSVLREVSAEKTLLYQLVVSAPIGFAVSFAIGEHLDPTYAIAALPTLLYQSVWVAAITYVVWFVLMREYPVSLLSSFTFLTPLFGVAFGAAFLGEHLSPRLLGALVLVAAGIYLVNRNAGAAGGSRQVRANAAA